VREIGVMWFERNWNPGKETQETIVRSGNPGWVTTEDQYLRHVSLKIACDSFCSEITSSHILHVSDSFQLLLFLISRCFSKSTKWEGTKDSPCLPIGIVAEHWRNRTENCSHQRLRTCPILLPFKSKFSSKSTYLLIREEIVLCVSLCVRERERERERGRKIW